MATVDPAIISECGIALPSLECRYRPRKERRIEADVREKLYGKRHAKMEECLNFGAKALPALAIGDTVVVQNQSDPLSNLASGPRLAPLCRFCPTNLHGHDPRLQSSHTEEP